MTFFLKVLTKGSKMVHNAERFLDFKNNENLRICFASFGALEKLFEINEDGHKLCLFELIIMAY